MLKTICALALSLTASAALAQFSLPSSLPDAAQAEALLKTANDKLTIHLNTASVNDLEKVPGLGPDLANSIVAARPFKSVSDLKNVKGMKEAVFAKIKDHVSL